MARRKAFLHVGLPRSGGGFIESALAEHAEALVEVGITAAAVAPDETFRAALEIRRDHRAWGYPRRAVEGTWAELCRRAAKGVGDVVVSQELLASCTRSQIDLLLDALTAFEVHAVITVRDPSGPDLAEVAARWSAALRSPQRVHVLVAPADGDLRLALWNGLGDLVGFDATRLPLSEPTVPAHLVRSLLRAVDGPPATEDERLERAERWRKDLADGGYDVRGDSADLLRRRDEAQQLPVVLDVLAALVVEIGALRSRPSCWRSAPRSSSGSGRSSSAGSSRTDPGRSVSAAARRPRRRRAT